MAKGNEKYFYGDLIQSVALLVVIAALLSTAFGWLEKYGVEKTKKYRSTHIFCPEKKVCPNGALILSGFACAGIMLAARESVRENP